MRDYRNINAWKMADDLAVEVYKASRQFPKEEIYGLTSQLRRAAYSVPANIAEGSGRGSQKDYLHFLHISRGSLSETQYFIHLSYRLEYLSESVYRDLAERLRPAFSCLHGLIKAVENDN